MAAQIAQTARELELVKQQLEAKQQELDELQNAQLQWAMDRQALLEQHESLKKGQATLQQTHDRAQSDLGRVKDELARAKARDDERAMERQALLDQHESLKQGHLDLQQGHDRAQVDLARLKDDVARAKTRDEERRGQLRQLEQERIQLAQKYEADQKKMRGDLKTTEDDLNNLQTAQLQWAVDRETLLKDRDTAVAKLAQLEQEWQKSRVELNQEKAEFQRLSDERSALLTKVKALEKDWQSREASFAEEKAALKKHAAESSARLAATQQDYEKIKALHADLAGESGRKAEEWTGREQRLTSEKNQLKVDLERIQAQLSDMMSQTNELHSRRAGEAKELEQAWQREKASLKAQLEEARKAAGSGPPTSQVLARYEAEKRAMQAQLEGLKVELSASGKNKDAAPALSQAKRDFEAKFRVIYDQSHDLNSPLNAINGFSNILLNPKENQTTPEERQEFISHISEAGRLLHEHINELIEFAKQEAGIQEKPIAMVPLAPSGGTKAPIILVADNDGAGKDRIQPFL